MCVKTEGLIEGFSNAFRKARISKLRTKASGADHCAFEILFI